MDKGFLRRVFGEVIIAALRLRVARGHALEARDQHAIGVEVAVLRSVDQFYQCLPRLVLLFAKACTFKEPACDERDSAG